jgi:hypothetical protein
MSAALTALDKRMAELVKLARELGMQPAHVFYIFLILLILAFFFIGLRWTATAFMRHQDQLLQDLRSARLTYQTSVEGCINMNTRAFTQNTEVHRQAIAVIQECTEEHRKARISGRLPGNQERKP